MTFFDDDDEIVRGLIDPYVPQTGSTFIDVGADAGRWSNYLAPRFERVIAIEPEPVAYSQLNANRTDNVLPVLAALWSEPMLIELYIYSSPTHASIFSEDSSDEWGRLRGRSVSTLLCAATTLDHLADNLDVRRCELVTIDTEGSEDQVVKGGLQFIREQVPELIIEVHRRENRDRIEKEIAPLGYRFRTVSDPAIKRGSEFCDDNYWLICQPPSRLTKKEVRREEEPSIAGSTFRV
ncbi:MAG: FkbM family methyltransferase [Nitrososphaerota archaeon]|nr:FkbM family methyltransferase [Nitrososphaerota archaeon]